MYTHIIEEEAFDHLTRAREVTNTLAYMLTLLGEMPDGEHVAARQIAPFFDYIENDLRRALQGCEEIKSKSTVQPLNVVR